MTINAKKHLEKEVGRLTLGKAIRSIRLCDEITQIDFAKQLKVSTQYLCDLEHDRKTISAKQAKKFADILGYSSNQFIILAIQDTLERDGIHLIVNVKAA
jgi:transcriptional regulator with XRE-family HTH domain